MVGGGGRWGVEGEGACCPTRKVRVPTVGDVTWQHRRGHMFFVVTRVELELCSTGWNSLSWTKMFYMLCPTKSRPDLHLHPPFILSIIIIILIMTRMMMTMMVQF